MLTQDEEMKKEYLCLLIFYYLFYESGVCSHSFAL